MEFGLVDYVMIDFIEERLWLPVYKEFKFACISGSWRFFVEPIRCLFCEPRMGFS